LLHGLSRTVEAREPVEVQRSTDAKKERLEVEKEVRDWRGRPEGEDGFGGGYQDQDRRKKNGETL
jgi:hypothetical protein